MSSTTYREIFEKATKQKSPYAYRDTWLRVERWKDDAIPKPREDGGGGFAEAGGNLDQLRFAFRAGAERAFVLQLRLRTLVEQTEENVRDWLGSLGNLEWKGESKHDGKVGLHILIGGEEKTNWDLFRVAFPRCRHPRFDPCKNDSWRE